MNNLEIKSVSVLDIIKNLFKSGLTRNKQLLLLMVLFCTFRLLDDFADTILSSFSFYISYSALMLLFSFVITAYLLLTALNTSKVFCKDRFLRSIILPFYQLKTLLTFIIRVLPIILIFSVVSFLLITVITGVVNSELSDTQSLIIISVLSPILLFLLLPYLFSTYLVVTHDINGFNALRLSKEIFQKNRKSSILIFIVFTFIPVIIFIIVTALIKDVSIYYFTLIAISIIQFINQFIMANFLKDCITYKEKEIMDIQ